jgi:hypothetical protein
VKLIGARTVAVPLATAAGQVHERQDEQRDRDRYDRVDEGEKAIQVARPCT